MHKRFDRMNRQAKVRTGVRFTEEMKGHVSFGERDYESGAREGQETGTRLMFHLTIEVEDLNRFAADVRREAIASGWVRCEALGGRLPVERGLFNLLVDETGSARKRMLYRLFFRDDVGHPLTLTGTKVVGAGSGLRPGATPRPCTAGSCGATWGKATMRRRRLWPRVSFACARRVYSVS
jgi:hypothetical protein